jgi:hypothetical protein
MKDKLLLANPMSRAEIRKIANSIRERFNFTKLKFPLLEFVEFIIPTFIDKDFWLEILPVNEMPNAYAQAVPEEHKIVLREDVYNEICKGNPRHYFTLAHEVGHYILHKKENILILKLSDPDFSSVIIRKFEEPEWQANTFAAELLVPSELIGDLSVEQIAKSCGVSKQVAAIQLNKKGG